MKKRGSFISFEGVDGAGKTAQAKDLCKWLDQRGIRVMYTREPGGTRLGEQLRRVLLRAEKADGKTETLLIAAARRAHVQERILPALRKGIWVVCDRFSDSTFAYQGGGRGVPETWIKQVLSGAEEGEAPDLTFYLDSAARPNPEPDDIFERASGVFFRKVRSAYLRRASMHPRRIRVIRSRGKDGQYRDKQIVAREIQTATAKKFGIEPAAGGGV